MAAKDVLTSLVTKLIEKLNYLNGQLSTFSLKGVSEDNGNNISLGTDDKPYFKERTPEELAQDYESNDNTNKFTDSYKNQLENIDLDYTEKLDKGSYGGTASDLLELIDNSTLPTISIKGKYYPLYKHIDNDEIASVNIREDGDFVLNVQWSDTEIWDKAICVDETKSTDDITAWSIVNYSTEENLETVQAEVTLNTADRHAHTNKSVLDKFGEAVNGKPTYNGNQVDTTIAQRDVYDGLDSNDNSVSLSAKQGKELYNLILTNLNALANRLRTDIDNQNLTPTEKANAIANLGITKAFIDALGINATLLNGEDKAAIINGLAKLSGAAFTGEVSLNNSAFSVYGFVRNVDLSGFYSRGLSKFENSFSTESPYETGVFGNGATYNYAHLGFGGYNSPNVLKIYPNGEIEAVDFKGKLNGETISNTLYLTSTSTTNTITTANFGKVLRIDTATATTVTINSGSLANIGDRCYVDGIGDGEVSLVAGSGVTINTNEYVELILDGKHSRVCVEKTGADTYFVFGNLKPL